jgi:hypothetical protein
MAAIVETLNAVKTALETAGLTVEIDRQEDEVLADAEYPLASLSWGGAELTEETTCDSYWWKATIIVDLWFKVETGVTVLAGCDTMASTVAAAFRADRSFGGKFFHSKIVALSDLGTIAADVGALTVTAEVMFQTAKGDWSTISS